MYIADFLSRAPLREPNNKCETLDSNFTISQINRYNCIFSCFEKVNICNFIGVTQCKLDLIRQATMNDGNLVVLKRVILSGCPDNKRCVPQCIHHYWVFRDKLSVCENVIFKGCRILVLKSVRPIMLRRIHACYIGVESCLRKERDILFWP